MPFTVSCAACDSCFLLGDDLFRRKVSGRVVTVKCRNCNAAISVDATEPATLPSQEPPPRRAHPAPPRPKHKEGDAATGTPLPDIGPSATLTLLAGAATPLPAIGTPLPRPTSATATPVPAGAQLSIWDAGEKSVEAARRGPPRRPPARTRAWPTEPELIEDIEEAPPSSSDAPTLDALTHEASPQKRTSSKKKAPDDFLVNLGAGTGGILGAPTIDVTGLASPPPALVEAAELTPRAGTIPLFDMSAVLPVANSPVRSLGSSLSSSNLQRSGEQEMPPTPSESGTLRDRKYILAPKTQELAPAPKTRRAGAAVWFMLVAAAAGVLLVVGLRRHGGSHPAPEPRPAAHPPALTESAPANDVTPSPLASAPAQLASAPVLADTAGANQPSSTSPTASTALATPVGAKSTDTAKLAGVEKPKPEASSALEKPAEAEQPVASSAPSAPSPEPADPGADFDRSAAITALKAAAAEAAACRKDGDPSGTASLTVTFAPSGRVTSANIQGPPFAGTATGGCIANAMRHAHVPAFSGERVTVNKTIVVE